MNMDRFMVDKRTTNYIIAINGVVTTDGASSDRPISRDLSKKTTFDLHGNRCVSRPANSGSILRHHIQHGLNVRRGAGDHAKDLAGGSLLLQRLFEFLEQPHVFDGNHGLVGESFE